MSDYQEQIGCQPQGTFLGTAILRKIDAPVCELSGLTEEEIRIVEDRGMKNHIRYVLLVAAR